MPLLTRLALKSSLIYFLLALALNLGFALPPAWSSGFNLLRLEPTYLHLFLVGWITQFIFGVANWLFPRHSRERFNPYPRLAWSTFILLNLGLVLRVIAEPFHHQAPHILGPVLILSGITQFLAGMTFIANLWTRIISS